MRTSVVAALVLLGGTGAAHDPSAEELVLPVIAAAPDFRLIGQDRTTVRLEDFRGRALAVTFIYTACPNYCPLLTCEPSTIEAVTRAYGVFAMKASNDLVDHTFLTSLVDPEGQLRVQYLGYRFDPEAFMADLLGLVDGS